jgi:hypothetical protein
LKIGIIVYSKTGNTLLAAERLKEALGAKGHSAAVEQVTIEGEISPDKPVKIISAPDPSKYDAVVFAAPVMAFSLNPAMKAYLSQMKVITGRKAGLLVTQQLPLGWMGGNRAVNTMKGLLEARGASAQASGIVHWGNETKREQQIINAVDALCGMF